MQFMESRMGILFVAVLAWCWAFSGSVDAQQLYNEPDQFGYSCNAVTQCQAYAAYRALAGDSLNLIGLRFGLSEEQVATASGFSTGLKQLSTGQLVLIPLNCSCVSGRSQYNTTRIIQQDDTFYLVSTNTFEGLTTYQAVERANPSVEPTKLLPGDKIIFPIRCSCPTRNQSAAGVKSLITYPVVAGDSVAGIARAWNASQDGIQSGNSGVSDPSLQSPTTLLLPITQDPPQLPKNSVPVTPAKPPAAAAPPEPTGDGGSSKTGTYVGIAVGASAAVVLAALGGICWRRRTRKQKLVPEAVKASSLRSSKGDPDSDGFNSDSMLKPQYQQQQQKQEEFLVGMADLVDSERPALFSYEELREATNGFSPSQLIQGSVYRGVLRGETVAIKEMKGGTTSREFKILCKVHHSNLVKLVGLCSGGDQLFLVYEYAENGSLSSCLHSKTPPSAHHKMGSSPSLGSTSSSSGYLSWNTRLQIAMDVATGLEYIHDYTKPGLVHKDIKSSNILLDSSFRAKIANFGMARLANNPTAPALTKHIAGTQGYMAPEYLAHGFITTKVDVYAFGVVLLELLTGREAILSNSSNPKERYLAEAIAKLLDESSESDQEHRIEKLRAWVDPVLENAVPWDSALSFAILARSCVDDDPGARPSMEELTFTLSKMLESSRIRYNSTRMEGR